MNRIQIKNFRSIVDSGEVPINRINILLGKNSSGKSSFIRLFPMMKQTVNKHRRGPVIWFDEHYDLGRFDTALSRHAIDDNKIMFGVKIDKPQLIPKCKTDNCDECAYINPTPNLFLNGSKYFGADVFLSSNHRGDSIMSQVVMNSDNYSIKLILEEKGDVSDVVINGESCFGNCLKWNYKNTHLLPNIQVTSNSKLGKTQTKLSKLINNITVLKNRYLDEFHSIKSLGVEETIRYWKKKKNNNPVIAAVLQQIEGNTAETKDIVSFVVFVNMIRFLRFLDNSISSYFDDSYYIAPIRYNYGRYMRNKEQSVENIDPIGKNVMEYIEGLSSTEQKSFNKFLDDSFKVTFKVKGKENKSIIVTRDGEADNLVDVGSGYSQVLPIATMLWDIVNRRGHYCNIPFTVLIEQPELHLHPSMQAEFAEMIMRVMNESIANSNNLNLVIETHSPIIINRIGRILRNFKNSQNVSKNDVSIYLFEKEHGVTKMTATKYNEDGRIENWPIGFLD